MVEASKARRLISRTNRRRKGHVSDSSGGSALRGTLEATPQFCPLGKHPMRWFA